MGESRKLTAKIVNDLLKKNICKYCCLRCINEKNPRCYSTVDKYLSDLSIKIESAENGEHDEPSAKQKKHNPCSACLGLLPMSQDNDFLDRISEEVTKANYDSEDMSFALSLPITILLRDYSVWLYVYDKYPQYYDNPFNSTEVKKQGSMVSVKEAWKWISANKICERTKKLINNGDDGNFHVVIHIEYEMDNKETRCLVDMFPNIFKCRSSQKRKFHGEVLTRKSVENALPDVEYEFFNRYYPVPPKVPNHFAKCVNIECTHESLYIAGRYNKFSRSLSQTPWLINGERRMESSVEEIISTPVSEVIPNNGIKFSSSGREDVDVRTLGNGRPFVLEVTNPRKVKLDFQTLRNIENNINQSPDVFVRDLQIAPKEDLGHIKMGEQNKTKTYNCYCIAQMLECESIEKFKDELKEINCMKDFIIKQKTPVRVLHRRSFAVRVRTVFWLDAKFHEVKGDKIYFMVTLQVEAGTYIKEFIHGDFGRTQPNMSVLLNREVDILALDVEEVALCWPPTISV